MKKTLFLLVILFSGILMSNTSIKEIKKNDLSFFPPDNFFTGTWHYQNGNRLFIVKLWQDGEITKGHYKMVEINNDVIGNTIYNSKKEYENGATLPYTIFGGIDNDVLYSTIHDNTIIGLSDDFKDGNLVMKINPVCLTCPFTASWKVTEIEGLKVGIEPGFSVPTDIILTKVSNTITND